METKNDIHYGMVDVLRLVFCNCSCINSYNGF
ncbi:hypothetical protein DFR97_003451 [Clostridium beijerinckii]|nr:hypothetical protein [Clostridium beijerinckii]